MSCFIKSFCQQNCCCLVLQVSCSSNVKSPRNTGHWPQHGFAASSARSAQSWVTCWVQSRTQLFISHGRLRGAVTYQTTHCFCKTCRITRPGLCVKPWAQAPQAASPGLPTPRPTFQKAARPLAWLHSRIRGDKSLVGPPPRSARIRRTHPHCRPWAASLLPPTCSWAQPPRNQTWLALGQQKAAWQTRLMGKK